MFVFLKFSVPVGLLTNFVLLTAKSDLFLIMILRACVSGPKNSKQILMRDGNGVLANERCGHLDGLQIRI